MLTPACAKPKLTYIEDVDFGLHLRVRPERLYMAMKGFFDESGVHGAELASGHRCWIPSDG